MARKAWEDLALSTQQRYVRAARKLGYPSAGAGRAARVLRETGELSPRYVFGKGPSPRAVIGETDLTGRQAASLVRRWQRVGIPASRVNDVLLAAGDAGMTYGRLDEILRERERLRGLPYAERKRQGRDFWETKSAHEPVELYWY